MIFAKSKTSSPIIHHLCWSGSPSLLIWIFFFAKSVAVDDQQCNLLARDTAHDHNNTYMQLSVSAEVKTDISINGKNWREISGISPLFSWLDSTGVWRTCHASVTEKWLTSVKKLSIPVQLRQFFRTWIPYRFKPLN